MRVQPGWARFCCLQASVDYLGFAHNLPRLFRSPEGGLFRLAGPLSRAAPRGYPTLRGRLRAWWRAAVNCGCVLRESFALCYQVRTLDKLRLTHQLGNVSDVTIHKEISEMLPLCLDL